MKSSDGDGDGDGDASIARDAAMVSARRDNDVPGRGRFIVERRAISAETVALLDDTLIGRAMPVVVDVAAWWTTDVLEVIGYR